MRDIYGTGGFAYSQVLELASSGDSLLKGIAFGTLRHWKEGVLCLYYPTSRLDPTKIDQILVSVDRFDASSTAADAFTLLTEGLEKPSQRETRPWNDYAWATWASWVDFDEPVGRLLMFAGHFDLVVVLFAITIGESGDPDPAYDLFQAIDPTR